MGSTSVIEFYKKSIQLGIKPIIGCEFYVSPQKLSDKTLLGRKGLSHLVLLAENQEGYRNLCKISSIAHLKGFYYKPRIDKDVLKEHNKGLIVLSGCLSGEIPKLILENKIKQAENVVRFYQSMFGEDNFYLELQDHGIDVQKKVNQTLLDMSQRLSIPLVAANNCHYLDKQDCHAHEVLLCIKSGKTINETDRPRYPTDEFYFKSKEEMYDFFKDYPDALNNSIKISERCNVEFDFTTLHIPKCETSLELTDEDIFIQKANEGFEKRIQQNKGKNPNADEKIYRDRLEHELSVITEKGFSSYFLIVADYINYAKENNISVGPGRGSSTSSLVAYTLGITEVDPIEYGLIFERFINPSINKSPDIDVDFCINGREKVCNYVKEKYGEDHIAKIITFGKLSIRAVIRDVGRVLNISIKEIDAITKLIPDEMNISIKSALNQEPRLKELTETNPEVKNLIDICRVLEGIHRHASTHAAGIVISDKPIVEYCPLYKGKKDEIVTQFDWKNIEHIGLIKFDFLGLRNLTIISETLSLIEKNGKTPPDLSNLNMNDPDTFQLLSKGDTTGVFQLESIGMKDYLKKIKPDSFIDMVCLNALYRPGPIESGILDDFIERKNDRKKVEYIVPELEPILKETYGLLIYQEQIMKIASSIAGYSLSDADELRIAIGRRIPNVMADHKKRFIRGGRDNDISSDKAKIIFELMETYGSYGFNKSHSVAYTLIAYQSAYLKAHFPKEFMLSLNL